MGRHPEGAGRLSRAITMIPSGGRALADLEAGIVLAGYRIDSVLGRGAMSIVYLAEDQRLDRRVALKVVGSRLAGDGSFREQFLRESQLASAIDHPNVLPIYSAGESGDLLYMAMRYVAGGDLGARLREGPLEPDAAVAIVAQLANALDAAHARGLVHRDVKPSNVLLDGGAGPDGSDHAYLADFGLTRRLADASSEPDTGRLVGTVDYMAPEQIVGGAIDGRADVYSLGCLLYECLTGEPPFPRSSDVEVVFAHLDEHPPAVGSSRAGLGGGMDRVVSTALAKDPADRYPTCREMARAASDVVVADATRRLSAVATRAATGRGDLGDVEAELVDRVADLHAALGRGRALAEPSPSIASSDVCPFKGLASFEADDADFFFGRERLVAELAARLVSASFLAIVGPSGSGKSSVLRAGLVPALAQGGLPGSELWRSVLVRPGDHPMAELRRVLDSDSDDPIAAALATVGMDERLVLLVDQLEELFTTCASDDERTRFVAALTDAAADPRGRAVVVVALRADFYGRFAAYPDLAERLGAHHVLVGPMLASELRRAVEGPATRVGLHVEPELVDALVDDVAGEPGALPLLSTSLLEMWQRHADWIRFSGDEQFRDRPLTLADYRLSGGVDGAVARLAETTYDRVPEPHRPLVRWMMLRLVGEVEGEVPVRRRAPLSELEVVDDPDTASVLDTLVDSRLVTVTRGFVEVAHEALLRDWPRLRDWIEEDGQTRLIRRHITEAASEWDASGRDVDGLLRGVRLTGALDWCGEHAAEMNALERAFISASRDLADQESRRMRRANRRLRALLASVVALLVVAVAGGGFAAVQRDQARRAEDAARQAEVAARGAEAAQLAQRLGAQALVQEDLDLSLLLARQAVAVHDTPQVHGFLLADLLRAPGAVGTMQLGNDWGAIRGIATSPDGVTLAVADYHAGLFFFDARTFEQIGEPQGGRGIQAVAYSPDGTRLAYADDRLVLMDTATRESVKFASLIPDEQVSRLMFTPDGTKLVAVVSAPGGTGRIVVRDAANLFPVFSVVEPTGFQGTWISQYWTDPSVLVSPDGRLLVTAATNGELTWWNLGSGRPSRTLPIPEGYRALSLSPDGQTVAVGLDDGLQLIDVRTAARREARGALTSNPNGLLFSPDGATVVSTGRDGTVTLWEVAALTPRATLRGHSDAVQQPAFSPDGRTLYTVSHDGSAIAWDVSGARGLGRRFAFTKDEGGSEPYPGRFSPDGRLIAVGLAGGGVGLWSADELRPAGALEQTGGRVVSLSFSPDGRTLAALADSGTATVWDVQSQSLRHEPMAVPGGGRGVSFSADGATLAVAGGDGVLLLDAHSGGQRRGMGDGRQVGDVAFSEAGDQIAFVIEGLGEAGGGDIEIHDLAQQSRLAFMDVTEADVVGRAIAWSPDGRLLATGGFDPYVHLWDAGTGRLVRRIAHNVGAAVWSIDFNPDGSVLAVAGGEGFASLWDVGTGAQIGARLGAGGREASLDVSPDGRRLLMTMADGTGIAWDIDPQSWAQRACDLANRALTRAEWEKFLPGRPYDPACTG